MARRRGNAPRSKGSSTEKTHSGSSVRFRSAPPPQQGCIAEPLSPAPRCYGVQALAMADAGEDVVLEDVVRLHAGLVGTAPPPTVTRSPPQEWISKEHVLRSPYGSSDGTAAALRAEAGSLPGFILSRADRWPDRTALVDSDSGSSITYAQLSTTTLRVAAGLSAAGFAAGDVFAVFAPSTLELPILLYAALRAGGCVTVCDPHFAVQDLANQLSDTAAKFLLTVPEMAEQAVDAAQLVGAQVQRVYVIGREPVLDCTPFSELLCPADDAPPAAAFDPAHSPAVLCLTGGGAALPKCVAVTHAALIAQAVQLGDVGLCEGDSAPAHSLTEEDTLLAATDSMPVLLAVTLAAHAHGAAAVCMADFDKRYFLGILRDYGVTCLHALPFIARLLVQAAEDYGEALLLPRLRELWVGSGAVDEPTLAAARSALNVVTRCGLVVTEAAGYVTVTPAHEAAAEEKEEKEEEGGSSSALQRIPPRALSVVAAREDDPVCVGYPLAGSEAVVAVAAPRPGQRPALQSLPHGHVGEVWARGPSMRFTYQHRSAEGAAALVEPHTGLTRLHDLGAVCPDTGMLWLICRTHEAVPLQPAPAAEEEEKAFMHLATLSDALMELPSVADAAVIALPTRIVDTTPAATAAAAVATTAAAAVATTAAAAVATTAATATTGNALPAFPSANPADITLLAFLVANTGDQAKVSSTAGVTPGQKSPHGDLAALVAAQDKAVEAALQLAARTLPRGFRLDAATVYCVPSLPRSAAGTLLAGELMTAHEWAQAPQRTPAAHQEEEEEEGEEEDNGDGASHAIQRASLSLREAFHEGGAQADDDAKPEAPTGSSGSLHDSLTAATQTIEALQGRLATALAENERLAGLVEAKRGGEDARRVRELTQRYRAAARDRRLAEAEAASAREEAQQLRRQLAEAEASREAEARRAQQLAQFQGSERQAASDLDRKQTQALASLTAHVRALHGQLSEANSALEEREERLADALRTTSKQEAEAAELRARCAELSSSLQQATGAEVEVQSSLRALREENEALRAQHESACTELRGCRKELDNRGSMLLAARVEEARLRDALAQAQEATRAAEEGKDQTAQARARAAMRVRQLAIARTRDAERNAARIARLEAALTATRSAVAKVGQKDQGKTISGASRRGVPPSAATTTTTATTSAAANNSRKLPVGAGDGAPFEPSTAPACVQAGLWLLGPYLDEFARAEREEEEEMVRTHTSAGKGWQNPNAEEKEGEEGEEEELGRDAESGHAGEGAGSVSEGGGHAGGSHLVSDHWYKGQQRNASDRAEAARNLCIPAHGGSDAGPREETTLPMHGVRRWVDEMQDFSDRAARNATTYTNAATPAAVTAAATAAGAGSELSASGSQTRCPVPNSPHGGLGRLNSPSRRWRALAATAEWAGAGGEHEESLPTVPLHDAVEMSRLLRVAADEMSTQEDAMQQLLAGAARNGGPASANTAPPGGSGARSREEQQQQQQRDEQEEDEEDEEEDEGGVRSRRCLEEEVARLHAANRALQVENALAVQRLMAQQQQQQVSPSSTHYAGAQSAYSSTHDLRAALSAGEAMEVAELTRGRAQEGAAGQGREEEMLGTPRSAAHGREGDVQSQSMLQRLQAVAETEEKRLREGSGAGTRSRD